MNGHDEWLSQARLGVFVNLGLLDCLHSEEAVSGCQGWRPRDDLRSETMKAQIFSVFLILALVSGALFGEPSGLLERVKPVEAGMDPRKLQLVDQKMGELIERDRLSGGIVVVARKGRVVHFELMACGIGKPDCRWRRTPFSESIR